MEEQQLMETLENLVRRYLRIKDTIRELNKEKKDIEDAIINLVEHTDIERITVDGTVVEFENLTKIKIK